MFGSSKASKLLTAAGTEDPPTGLEWTTRRALGPPTRVDSVNLWVALDPRPKKNVLFWGEVQAGSNRAFGSQTVLQLDVSSDTANCKWGTTSQRTDPEIRTRLVEQVILHQHQKMNEHRVLGTQVAWKRAHSVHLCNPSAPALAPARRGATPFPCLASASVESGDRRDDAGTQGWKTETACRGKTWFKMGCEARNDPESGSRAHLLVPPMSVCAICANRNEKLQ